MYDPPIYLRLLPVAVGVFLFAYFFGRWQRGREEMRANDADPYAEDWSGGYPNDRNPPLKFAGTKVGDQFVIDAELGGYVFERINKTAEGNNARCDLYDTFVHDNEAITKVSTPLRIR